MMSEVVENTGESSFGEAQQVEGIGKGDIRRQVRFVERLFKVAA
jgi:hypothetical protein